MLRELLTSELILFHGIYSNWQLLFFESLRWSYLSQFREDLEGVKIEYQSRVGALDHNAKTYLESKTLN